MADSTRGAVILAGGAGRRLGGVDKPGLVIGNQSLLDTAIEACTGCADIVVVGQRRPTSRPVRWTVEDPPGSGPLAALAAGISQLPAHERDHRTRATVAVLAADLPSVTAAVVDHLHRTVTASHTDVAMLVDGGGRYQPMIAVYSRPALDSALASAGDLHGVPFHALLAGLRIATLPDARAAEDIDTPQDLARWSETPRTP